MISHDRLIAKTVVRLAMEDPPMVKAAIARLREQGDIEPDDLVYLDRIADRWRGLPSRTCGKDIRQPGQPDTGVPAQLFSLLISIQ